MIDAAAAVTSVLRTDGTLLAECDGRVYCDAVPADADAPFIVARTMGAAFTAPPSTAWDTVEVQVDVVGSEPGEAVSITDRARLTLAAASGTQVGDTAVASMAVVATSYALDTRSSPARPRWVIAVEVTARTT